MKPILTALLLLLTVNLVKAQKYEELVPNNAEFVAYVNGQMITDKIGEKKIQKSEAFASFLNQSIFRGKEGRKLNEIGIHLSTDFVSFFCGDTLMEYLGSIYGIKDAKLFEKYVREYATNDTIIRYDGFNVLYYSDNYSLLAWNDDYAMFVSTDYLHEDIRPISRYDWDHELYYYEGDDIELAIPDAEYSCDEGSCEEGEIMIEEIEEYPTRVSEIDSATLAAEKQAAEEAFQKESAERIILLRSYYHKEIANYFGGKNRNNILSNPNYTNEKKANADFYVWLDKKEHNSRFDQLYNYYRLGGRRYFRKMLLGASSYFGNRVAINGMFNETSIDLTANIDYLEEIAKYFNEIYRTKLSPKLMNYISKSDAIAVSSFTVDAEKVWKYYPRIYAEFYATYFNRDDRYREEIEVLLDFIDIFMDESELSKIFTGDGVILFEDIAETEVKYLTYEYSEDYSERKQVEKTRKEVRPQFLGLFTTANQEFLEKLLRLAVKQEMMYKGEQYYYTSGKDRDLPFQIGFTIQDGVLAIGTDITKIEAIGQGKKYNAIPENLQNDMRNNQGYVMLDIQKLLERIPDNEIKERDLELLEYARKNTRKLESFTNLKDNQLQSSLHLEIPKKAKNGAVYLWDFMDEMYTIENKK